MLLKTREAPSIFASGITLPEKVFIVASGPNGRDYYHRIPDDSYTIAVNKAVLISDIHPDMWILNSMNKKVRSWFEEADHNFEGIRIFKQKCLNKMPDELARNTCFSYAPNASLEDTSSPLQAGTLYSGGTVTGFAIQIAARLGAKEVILCGADMSGQNYWDGSATDHADHGELWHHTENLSRLIQHLCKGNSLNIRSLSPTKLDVPVEQDMQNI